MNHVIYYLPGYGGPLASGLGEGLAQRGWDIAGRETRGDFRDLPFQAQVETVAQDLRQHFWREDARVVAVSFGGYLFLHAQARLPPFPGQVLLLSPIVGEFGNSISATHFVPPQAQVLRELAEAGRFKPPARCGIHVGSDDWQSSPPDVCAFGQQVGIHVTVVPGAGHQLGKDYVGPLLDSWIGMRGASLPVA